jgi:alkylation response protein AidB-like acyl-CoA dehydrogenase
LRRDEQLVFRFEVISFARKKSNEGLLEWDRIDESSLENPKKYSRSGVHGLPIPDEYRGAGAPILIAMLMTARLGYGCGSHGLNLTVNFEAITQVNAFLDRKQQERFETSGL